MPRRPFAALIAFATSLALALTGALTAVPAAAAESSITEAVFRWGINAESNAAAFAPGTINLLAAGVIDMTSAADRVTATNWKQSEGNVSIEKRQSDGSTAAATFAGLRTTAGGVNITTGNGLNSGHEVVITDGEGSVDVAAGTASIQWAGTFTVVYYSGMTRFWVKDPRIDVAADGTGTVTATLGGWGTSMDNPDQFSVIDPVPGVVIAKLTGVQVGADGITVTPDYAGAVVTSPADAIQQVQNAHFGSFPQSFVDFQLLTGQHAYWFSSGGAADSRKIATPISIAYDAQVVAVPVITSQPVAVSVNEGQDAVFTIATDATGIQWQRSADGTTWTDIDGATSAELRFIATAADADAQFRAVVTNAGGSTTSDAATLTVTPAEPGDVVVTGAQFEWAYSGYAQEGVFGKWRQWTDGTGVTLTSRDGKSVTGLDADAGRDFTAVRFDGGTGTIDSTTGAGTISWPNSGSWKLNAYPAQYGAPDETLSAPILTIAADGSGTLSFSAFLPAHNDVMYGTGIKPAVGPDRKVLATFSSVSVVDGVITAVPEFAGREYVAGPDLGQWQSCEGLGGSWPAEWIDFLPTSVRAHYYTTSCTGLNLSKPPYAFTVATASSAPVIVEQPSASTTTLAASNALGLAVVATGSPISYQWQRSTDGTTWTDVEGQTDAAYTAFAAPSDNGASFRVVVGTGASAVTSDAVGPFTVTTAPIVVTRQPRDSTTGIGNALSFAAYATGSPRPTATWERSTDGGATWGSVNAGDFIDRSTDGSTTSDSTVLILAAEESDAAQYRVTWSNGLETVVSNVVTGSVLNQVPTVRAHPADVVAVEGTRALFSGSFNGAPAATPQWQFSTDGGATWADWTATAGTGGSLLITAPTPEQSGWQFRLRGTAPAGTAYTNPATLTVFAKTGERQIDTLVMSGELGVSSARLAIAGQGFTVPSTGAATALRVGLVAKAAIDDGSYTDYRNFILATSVQRATLTTYAGSFNGSLTIDPVLLTPGTEYVVVVIAGDATDRSYDTVEPLFTMAQPPIEISGAQLQWTYSGYAQAGVFGPWRQWATGSDVNVVSVNGQAGSGQLADAGKTFTGARFDGGTGTLDPVTGAGSITWPNSGAWVINAYPASIGAPDETLAAPILTIAADGSGTLSFDATLPAHNDVMNGGGWVEQVGPARTVVATFSSVTVAEDGKITVVPDYEGRSYDAGDTGSPWASCEGVGGAWPTEWINFVAVSVRAHYYTTSCAGLNLTKGPHPFTISTAPVALEITKQQPDVTANASRPVTLAVGANGNPMPVVTWQQRVDGDWVTVDGLSGLTVTFDAEARHAGTWRPVFTVGSTVVNGEEFDFIVNAAAPSFASAPSLNYAEYGDGEEVVITSVIAGYPTPSVVWERSTDGGSTWTAVTEGTELYLNGDLATASLRFIATSADHGALYRETASNGVGENLVGTAGPIVIKSEPIVITTQPISYLAPSLPVSGSAVVGLTVEATGFPIRENSYKWQVLDESTGQWTDLATTSDRFTVQLNQGTASYRVVVGEGSAAVISEVSRVVVIPGQAGRIISVGSPSVAAGETATFAPSFNVAGNPTPSLQWQRSNDDGATWANLPGETAATLSFVTTRDDNGAQFRILVDNGVPSSPVAGVTDVAQIPGGTASISAVGTLTVLLEAAPVITQQPISVIAPLAPASGDPVAVFRVEATGEPTPSIQWERRASGGSWAQINGATAPSLELAYTAADADVQVRAIVSNAIGTVTSDTATLTLGDRPTVEPLAEGVSVVQGDDLVVEATVDGTAATLLWEMRAGADGDWSAISGADSATLTVAAAEVRHGQQYRVTVSSPIPSVPGGAAESVTSLPVQVNLLAPEHDATDIDDEELTAGTELELLSFDGKTAKVDVGDEHAARYVGAWLHSDPVALGWQRTAADGVVAVGIPANTPAGSHRLVIVTESGELIGWAAVTVAAPSGSASPAALQNTGAEFGSALLLALVALLLGAGAVGSARWSRRQS